MNLFAGKSTNERNKIVVAIVLGVVALGALYLAFGRGIFSGSTTVAVTTASPSPKPATSQKSNKSDFEMPSENQQNFGYVTTQIVYNGGSYSAPDPVRNIFAFYEPPLPCPTCPPPTPKPVPIVTPSPTPTPPMHLEYVTPQTIYAGSNSFRLEANGDKFDASARLYFRQSELPTQFISPQKLVANVPASMIATEGPAQVIAQTPDGKIYSDQLLVNIQAPPKPAFKYIGMIARKRYNNDTAYFMEDGKTIPIGARLNDVVGGRFRLVSISSAETVFEDVNLGFKHRVKLYSPPPGTATNTGTGPVRGGFPNDGNYIPYNPNFPNPNIQPQDIPGIPNNIPRQMPPQNVQRPQPKKDEDDEDGDGKPDGKPID